MKWSFPTQGAFLPAGCADRTTDPAASLSAEPATFESGQPAVEYALVQPDGYTDRYAYPLIVWFHDDGGDEQDVLGWLPQLSPQNYLGLGLRGPLPVRGGLPQQRTWSTGPEHLDWLEDQLLMALIETAGRYSLHVERIVAAGIGRGATIALQMLLRRPDLFTAGACLNAQLPPGLRLDRWGQYVGRNLWLGHSRLLADGGAAPAIDSTRLLHSAGLEVFPHPYEDEAWPLETLGRDIDRWLMPVLCGESVIV